MQAQAGSNASDGLVPIEEAARRLGTTTSALRYYDDRGLVRSPVRARGRRWYSHRELRGLALLRIAQVVGIPLDAAALLLDRPGPGWREAVAERIGEIERLIERAGVARDFLEHVHDCPSEDPIQHCPSMTGALDELVAGLPVEELARRQGALPDPAGAETTPAGVHEVAVLVRPGVLPMELGLVHEIFSRARTPDGNPAYRVRTCALRPGRIETDADFTVTVGNGPEILGTAGTVVLPASHATDETPDVLGGGLGEALAGLAPGIRVASICTAAFALAEAGMLDGRRATTHWMSAPGFRRRFPRVELDPDVLYVDAGDVLTAAGEASGIDLCLHLVRRDLGAAAANDVARRAVVPPYREGGQAQYIAAPVRTEDDSGGTARLRDWLSTRLDRPVGLAEMAARLHVSIRTLTRRFRDETGQSPTEWLVGQRVRLARELLETTDLPVERIADRCGFGTATVLRQHFAAQLGVSPRAYRRTFRGV